MLLIVLLTAYALVLVRTAWISDDSALTLRSVMNLLSGYGPTFNIDERVQVFTHPLWFLVLSAVSFCVGNVFVAAFGVALVASMAAAWILVGVLASSAGTAAIAGLGLLLSKAHIDYSTSGLENPASHLLIAATMLVAGKGSEHAGRNRAGLVAFLTALICLNRPDLILLTGPLLAAAVWRVRSSNGELLRCAAGVTLPILAWGAFSTYYYGFPLPNTAYAKLGTGIPATEAVLQGLRYLLNSAALDPLTLGCMIVATVSCRRSSLGPVPMVGVWTYVAYVVWIGGDFMSGRLLSAPLVMALGSLALAKFNRFESAVTVGFVCILGGTSIGGTLLSSAGYSGSAVPDGIADERGIYYQGRGLLHASRGTFAVPPWEAGPQRRVEVMCGGLGFNSMKAGPRVHYVDPCGLADPLMSRLPAYADPHWRVGHYYRSVPEGYIQSIESATNAIADPLTRRYYESIRLVTRGRLNDPRRLREIIRLNAGLVPKPDWRPYRYPTPAPAARVGAPPG